MRRTRKRDRGDVEFARSIPRRTTLIACLLGKTHRFHCVCHFSQSSLASGIAARLPRPEARARIRAMALSWLLSSVMTSVAVGRVWYAMSGLGTAAGAAKTVGPAGKKMNARIVTENGLCVFMAKGYLWSGMESRKFVVMSTFVGSQAIMNV